VGKGVADTVIRFLDGDGGLVNAQSDRGETPALLLRRGADVRATDDGRSALALAQDHGHDDVVQLLLDAGA
jgi:ankyrin repeat protein